MMRPSAAAMLGVVAASALATEPVVFRRTVLTESFHAEAAGRGDIDRDGRADIVTGNKRRLRVPAGTAAIV